MRTIKSMIKTEVIYDEEMKNKYLIRKEWDKDKKKALVIMKNAGQADEIIQDHTTVYVINNLSNLAYGVTEIVNLFPPIDRDETKESDIENLKCIQEIL